MDKLDFLDGETPVETPVAASTEPLAETPAAEPTPEPTTAPGPERGPDGKFISKAPEAITAPDPQAPASPPVQAEVTEAPKAPDGYVPLAALEKLREDFNAYKRQQQQAPREPAPDPYEDFEAYQAHQQNERAFERAEFSREFAELKHGPEVVQQAQQWAAERFAADPMFRERSLSARDPYGFAIGEFQRDQALSLLSDPKLLEQFKAWQAGTGPAPTQHTPAPSAPAPPKPVAPTPSITSAPSAGGAQHVPTGPGQAYGAIFG